MSIKPTKKNQESESLKEQIVKLEKQLESFKYSNDHFLKNKLFLHYDIKEPEKVIVDCETRLPVLAEVDKKKIKKGKESDPTHLIIEGDNYHALSVLNYTHVGKIDLIYIDPPYNTGKKDFIYNDRFVDREDSYRHSKWLSFMANRLRLAKNLLAETGVIFISIDDNEQAHLRLLCDQIFGEDNFVQSFIWHKKTQPSFLSKEVANVTEYILCYRKSEYLTLKGGLTNIDKAVELLNISNGVSERTLPIKNTIIKNEDFSGILKAGVYGNGELKITLHDDSKIVKGIADKEIKLTGRFKWAQERIDDEVADGAIIYIKSTTTLRPTLKRTNGQQNIKPPISLLSKYLNGIPTNTDASNEMKEIFDGISPFDNPKPTDLIKYLIEAKTFDNKSATILDFFAGSGTTGHAVLKLNAQDGGIRQFILCSTNDEKEPIVDKVTYPRIKKVIDGYSDNSPIPANLRYFQTDFVDKKGSASQLKIDLTRQCAEMLCVKENVFEAMKLKKVAKNYKFFKNDDKYLGVFFDFFTDAEFAGFIRELNALPKEAEKAVYVFVLDGSAGILADEFAGVANCEVKEIPQKILDIYKQLASEVARK